MPESWSPSPTFKKLLLTIAAIPVGVFCGFVVAILVVGAPHSVPGLLLRAPEPVRNTVGIAIVYGTPLVFVLLVWRGLIGRALSRRSEAAPVTKVDTMSSAYQESLMRQYRNKSTDELQAILATRGQARYAERAYELAEGVLKERGVG